ncbi:MAG: serine hydrolase [Candidatus Obscuribacter sp.]|nr:serine hydrolase [Candidatus Obscuribacter sp.]MBP6350074.1 serine hydrolase [Candidatus Obscuribacter sp.]MBP7577731.1 serine hydrolase [Candidatus Obscuribacter sp.]
MALPIIPSKRLLIGIATAATLLVASTQQASAEVPKDFDDFVNKSMHKYNVPGASVAIVDGDNVITRGYGVRSVEKPGAVDADTLFMLASNSKPFTAALLAVMVDRKKIDWDDHVMDYLPEFVLKDQYATRMSTPKDLLAHRTGLPAFTGDGLEALGFTRQESLRRFRFIEPSCSFRAKANYSNPGLVCAGELAARLGGDTYENLIKKEIFAPLGMSRSGVTAKDHDTASNVAEAHMPLPTGGSKVVPWDSSDTFGPAGCLNSTAKDMARWMQMQLNKGTIDGHPVISPESIEEMHTPAMVDEPSFSEMAPIDKNSGLSYGLGWGIYHYKGHVVLEKGGARAGMRSVCMLVPDKRIGVTVLSNQNLNVLPEAIRAYVLDKMVAPADSDLQASISDANEQIKKMFSAPPLAKPTSKPTLALKAYAGDYANDLYGTVKVICEGDKLRWEAGPGKITGTLTHAGYDTFELAWPPGRISLPEDVTFTLSADGTPTQLTTESFGLLKRVGK